MPGSQTASRMSSMMPGSEARVIVRIGSQRSEAAPTSTPKKPGCVTPTIVYG